MKSLERRLQYSLSGVLIIILVGLLTVANLSTRHILQEFVTSRLEHDANNLLEVLRLNQDVAKVGWRRINPIYNKPYSGHYYSIRLQNGEYISSPSLQGESLAVPDKVTTLVQHDIPGPHNQRLIMWTKTYEKNGQQLVITLAEDMSPLKERRNRFRLLFIFMGIVGIILMLIMQRFIIRRLFLSLDKTRQEVQLIESGQCLQLSENVPLEIYPLVKEFNHSLSLMQDRLERSRNSLGNLAHALKTPLSLLIQKLDNMHPGQNDENNLLAKQQAERIRLLTERELKRARMAGLGNTSQRFSPREELPILVDVLTEVHRDKKLTINIIIAHEVKLFGDREDMLELFGNLLDNACKWANSQINCSLSGSDQLTILIEDDGIGRSAKEIEQLTSRGTRLDESVDGHGLGLAICNDIIKLYAGTIRFDRSEKLGGFSVEVRI